MANSKAVAARLMDVPTVRSMTATFVVKNPDGTVQVDFGLGPVTIYSAGFYTPLPGDNVRTLAVDGLILMLGPVVPKSVFGRIIATGDPRLTVRLPDLTEVSLPYMPGGFSSGPTVNQDVLINWPDGGVVEGNVTEVPSSSYLPKPVAVEGTQQKVRTTTVEFIARDSGNYWTSAGSWNKNEVWASPNNTGAYFYNNIAGTIPNNADIELVQIYVNEFQNSFPNNPAYFGLHSKTSKSGNPSVTSGYAIDKGSGWRTLPTSFGDALKTGAALGIGTVATTGLHKFRGRGSGPSNGKLRIRYSI